MLAEVDKHPSLRYFVYKSIILHNLFGVDIMAEAVEICKLRLFLKLVSQVDRAVQLGAAARHRLQHSLRQHASRLCYRGTVRRGGEPCFRCRTPRRD